MTFIEEAKKKIIIILFSIVNIFTHFENTLIYIDNMNNNIQTGIWHLGTSSKMFKTGTNKID